MGDRKTACLGQRLALGIAVLVLAISSAAAQTSVVPVKAKLSISSPNKSTTQYAGIRLPGNQTTNFSFSTFTVTVGVKFKLEVWYSNGSGPVDVTTSPNTVFSGVPSTAPFIQNALILGTPGLKVVVTGRFTQSGQTVSSSLTIQEELYKAPGSYDGGRAQKQLYASLDDLSCAISSWAARARLSAAQQMPVWNYLDQLRLYLRLWWAGKSVNPLIFLGDALQQLGAPTDILIRLSRIALAMKNAGLISITPSYANGVEIQHAGDPYPAWLPHPDILLAISPPITVFWYGL